MELAVRSVDPLLLGRAFAAGEAHEIAPSLVFRQHGRISFMPDAQNLIGRHGLDAEARSYLAGRRPPEPEFPTGVFEFNDVHLAPPFGMILDFKSQTCWLGSMLGWSERDFRKSEKFDGCTVLDKAIRFDLPAAGEVQELDEVVLASAPHYGNYGHWLLEFLPRIDLALAFGHGGVPFYCHSGQDWSVAMASCLAPVSFLPQALAAAFFLRVKRLIVPSMARILNSGDEMALKATWAKLSSVLAKSPAVHQTRRPRRIAVSRHGWTNSVNLRRLVNAGRIEQLLADGGFDVVCPHEMTLAEQRDVFHNADVVVGEDGSAMHNTIFCRPGTRIGLIAMGRINYIHLLTAKALGHRVTYIPSEPADHHEANWFLEMYRLRPRVLNQSLPDLLGEEVRP